MARLTQGQTAQKFALRGDVESALVELSAMRERGDAGASASLAEIAAYGGQWSDVVEYARVVVAAPSSVRTLNVYADMASLVALAGTHLGNWDDVQRISDSAMASLAERPMLEGYAVAARALAECAAHCGRGTYVWRRGVSWNDSLEKRNADFAAALAELSIEKKKRFKTTEARREHLFALAEMFSVHDGAVTLYDQEGLPDLFAAVVFTASGLARCGRTEEAWRAIQSKLPRWWPVEETQVAPVALLVDDGLGPLMTQDRCAEVLRTPRGREAVVQ